MGAVHGFALRLWGVVLAGGVESAGSCGFESAGVGGLRATDFAESADRFGFTASLGGACGGAARGSAGWTGSLEIFLRVEIGTSLRWELQRRACGFESRRGCLLTASAQIDDQNDGQNKGRPRKQPQSKPNSLLVRRRMPRLVMMSRSLRPYLLCLGLKEEKLLAKLLVVSGPLLGSEQANLRRRSRSEVSARDRSTCPSGTSERWRHPLVGRVFDRIGVGLEHLDPQEPVMVRRLALRRDGQPLVVGIEVCHRTPLP